MSLSLTSNRFQIFSSAYINFQHVDESQEFFRIQVFLEELYLILSENSNC